jgi:HAD superfamily hydrolase (TIGR01457 family)
MFSFVKQADGGLLRAIGEKKLFILDMDGTFYLGNRMIDGSLDFIRRVGENGKKFVFFTNNASKTSRQYVKKLAGMGCHVDESNVITSADVTVEFLKRNHPGEKVYLLGTPELEDFFIRNGINLVENAPDIVVVSFDLTMTHEKVAKACKFIREGARFLATHMDLNCPTEDGFIPDCGSICAMITASTGIEPRFFGKPFAETISMISSITGCIASEMAIIGDRLYTDIAMGVQNGVTSILVLTGETGRQALERSEVKPDLVFDTIKDIIPYV